MPRTNPPERCCLSDLLVKSFNALYDVQETAILGGVRGKPKGRLPEARKALIRLDLQGAKPLTNLRVARMLHREKAERAGLAMPFPRPRVDVGEGLLDLVPDLPVAFGFAQNHGPPFRPWQSAPTRPVARLSTKRRAGANSHTAQVTWMSASPSPVRCKPARWIRVPTSVPNACNEALLARPRAKLPLLAWRSVAGGLGEFCWAWRCGNALAARRKGTNR